MSSKLRLNLDDLSVESFSPAAEMQERGTVNGAEDTADGQTYCARTQCMLTECIANSCVWTQCNNISCAVGGNCGGGGAGTYGEPTCNVVCHTDPTIE